MNNIFNIGVESRHAGIWLLQKTSKEMHQEKTCEYNIQLTEEKSRAWRENGNIPLMRHTSFLIRVTPDMLNSISMVRGDLASVNITGCNFLRFHKNPSHLF
jgi:hypothetical protein